MISALTSMSTKFIKIMTFAVICHLTTLSAIWNPPVTVSDPGLRILTFTGPTLSVNAANNAVSVWANRDSSGSIFYANISGASYTFGSGWAPPVIINAGSDDFLYNQGDSDVAMNRFNYAVAAWEATESFDSGNYSVNGIFSSTRLSNGIWSSVQRVCALNTVDNDFFPENPAVAVNDSALSVAAWYEIRNGQYYIMANFLPFGGTWGTPAELYNAGSIGDREGTPRVAIDPSGNVVVVFRIPLPFNNSGIGAATFNSTTNLWTTVVLDPSTSIGSNLPTTAIDNSGNAIALWVKNNGLNYEIFSSSFTFGSGWGASFAIPQSTSDFIGRAFVVMDQQGNATAIWDPEFNSIKQVYSSTLPFGGVWSVPLLISTEGSNNSLINGLIQKPISVDDQGNVIVITSQGDIKIQSIARFVLNGWQAPENIYISPSLALTNIGYGSCGFAIALWANFDENEFVQASDNFGIFPPPADFRGRKCCQKFASQKNCLNILNWTPSGPCILYYEIYRNDKLIGTIPAGSPTTFTDPYACKCKTVTYSLVSYNIYGAASSPILLTINK